MAIMTPRREAHRKVRKGKNEGVATRCNTVAFGDWGLMSLDNERITSRQIEAAVKLLRVTSSVVVKSGFGFSHIRQLPKNHLTSKWVAVKANHNSTLPKLKLAQLCSKLPT